MSVRVRNARFGFGFYLGISALIHAVGFLLISFAPLKTAQPEPKEVVPAKIKFQEPVREGSVGGGIPDYMPMDAEVSTDEDARAIRESTGLPSHMRRSPRPHAYGKNHVVRYVKLPDPSSLRKKFQPPSAAELPEGIKQIDVSLGEMETIGRIPTIESSDTGTGGGLMKLGEGEMDTVARRRLLQRPSFPYAKARPELPKYEMTIEFDLEISSKGTVENVVVSEGSDNKRLDKILKNWIKQWKYQSGETTVRQSVTIQIPGT